MEGLSVDTYLTSVRRSRYQCFIVFEFCISICSGRLVTCVKEIRI